MNEKLIYVGLGVFGILGPIAFPDYVMQMAVLWIMVLMATTWDITGGQMGYNSLGNITFFGVGMYVSAAIQVSMFYDLGEFTASYGAIKPVFTETQYYTGLILGIIAAGIACAGVALLLGICVFGLRGPYFAIGTLGIAVAAREIAGTIEVIGAGAGIAMPFLPLPIEYRSLFFYVLCFVLAVLAHLVIRWLFKTQFGLAANAIRDDEDKAEAMGIPTLRYKQVGWAIAAFFMGCTGAVFGNMVGYIEPLEVAFPVATFGIFMVAMSLLGGKGTLWGPVLGAILFHVVKEATWTYLLGLQWVVLGLILIVNIVYFQQGIMGWLQTKYPEKFGIIVDQSNIQAKEEA
ncbi:MAG: branched-chain amino acid ABC transporter permease [Alphaproteobacteria bacterium]|nr:branched-chain amino acid ABC transporter permease [Alphaproteobacteria bacterium]